MLVPVIVTSNSPVKKLANCYPAVRRLMIFGMHTMHASTANLTNRFRHSCDVRFQPASEPADPRWIRDSGGHSS